MGYRSQVAGCFSVDRVSKVDEKGSHYSDYDKDKFKQMIGFIKLSKFWELWNRDQDASAFGWQDGYFVLYGDDWKWYPDYEDVKAWDDLWHQMQQIEGISGYFLRVGEEHDDVEELEFGEDPCRDHFFPTTSMYFSGDHFLGKRETDEEGQTKQACADSQEV